MMCRSPLTKSLRCTKRQLPVSLIPPMSNITAFAHPAVLVVDMLNDFVTGALGCERAQAIVPAVVELVDAARQKDIPVIFCNDSHERGDSELEYWGEHAMAGTVGSNVIPELTPHKEDRVVPKHHFSGFFDTSLDRTLRMLGVETVIIAGIYANICVLHTVADAYQSGYRVVVASDAVNAMTENDYKVSLEYMKSTYGAAVLTNAEIIGSFPD